jgi:hypothetical protein
VACVVMESAAVLSACDLERGVLDPVVGTALNGNNLRCVAPTWSNFNGPFPLQLVLKSRLAPIQGA